MPSRQVALVIPDLGMHYGYATFQGTRYHTSSVDKSTVITVLYQFLRGTLVPGNVEPKYSIRRTVWPCVWPLVYMATIIYNNSSIVGIEWNWHLKLIVRYMIVRRFNVMSCS